MSDNRSVATVPVVTVWVYRNQPSQASDLASTIRNLLYSDWFYLKMEYDEDYINTYLARLQTLSQIANANKPWMLAMGAGMILTAPLTCGASAVWGTDLIVGQLTGKSLFDHIATGLMTVAGLDKNYIGNFSVWHLTSDRGLDLVLNQVLAEVLSFGIGTIAHKVGSFLSNRLSMFGSRADRMAAELGNNLGKIRVTSGWRHLIVRFSDALMGIVEAPSMMAVKRLVLSGLWWFAPAMLVLCVVVYSRVVRYEEAHLRAKYGEAYERFVSETPRWWPRRWEASAAVRVFPMKFLGPSVLAEAYNVLYLAPFVVKELMG
jgi:hypothetical protein